MAASAPELRLTKGVDRLSYAGLTLVGVVFALLLIVPLWDRIRIGANDFAAFYAGGKLAFSPQLYSADAVIQAQQQTAGFHSQALHFIRPPWYAALLSPLTALEYPHAHAVWFILMTGAVLAAVPLWIPHSRPLAYAMLPLFPPASLALANGQDLPLVFLAMGGAAALARRGQAFTAGLLLAVCQIKFHLLLPVLIMMIAGRYWRVLLGALTGSASLGLASAAVFGWGWPMAYLQAIRDPATKPGAHIMPTLFYIVQCLPGGPFLWLLGVAGTAAAAWLIGRRASVASALATAPLLAIPLLNHVWVTDVLLAFPLFITLAVSPGRYRRIAGFALLTPALWLLVLRGWPAAWLAGGVVLLTGLAFGWKSPAWCYTCKTQASLDERSRYPSAETC